MKRDYKDNMLQIISGNLELFYPYLKGFFVCPTCLKKISLNDTHLISEAHIIPKSAGGKKATFLCKKCNNYFGSKQDKWFGEIVNPQSPFRKSVLKSSYKKKYFKIDGIKVNGRWEVNNNGEFRFIILLNRNSPEVNKLIKEKFSKIVPHINMEIPLPILENKDLIDVGYLTAGYLMWFSAIGYSWIFQNHMNHVRDQIRNPDTKIIQNSYVFTLDRHHPIWYGIAHIENYFVPAFGINDVVVVYPSSDCPNLYTFLKTGDKNIKLFKNNLFPSHKEIAVPPAILMYENNVIIAPDTLDNIKDTLTTICFTRDNPKGYYLTPVSNDEFEKHKNDDGTIIIDLIPNIDKFKLE